MSKIIKSLGLKLSDQNSDDELRHLIEQLEHKDNVLLKEEGITQEVTISGITLIFVNGQFKGTK